MRRRVSLPMPVLTGGGRQPVKGNNQVMDHIGIGVFIDGQTSSSMRDEQKSHPVLDFAPAKVLLECTGDFVKIHLPSCGKTQLVPDLNHPPSLVFFLLLLTPCHYGHELVSPETTTRAYEYRVSGLLSCGSEGQNGNTHANKRAREPVRLKNTGKGTHVNNRCVRTGLAHQDILYIIDQIPYFTTLNMARAPARH